MNNIFSITTHEIQSLNDEQSRELIARLCRAELSKHGISQSAVTWGGDQRAKDGGVDVRVDIDPPQGMTGYIIKDHSAFQVKAEKFAAAKIKDEMAPKGILRQAIIDLATSNGAYVIVSTREKLSDSSRSSRINAMFACLSNHGLFEKVIVDFYDCRKLADWIEQHQAIVIWMKHALGKPVHGWKPYAPWAYIENDLEAKYLVDDRVKVFEPNKDEGSDILSAIDSLRRELMKNVSVRIVGLSGVGKTRLVQALFDSKVSKNQPALDPENVIYTDLSDNPTPQPSAMVESLISEGSDSVVVVDNCGPDVHNKLTEIIKRPGCKLRLITVEYDIRDDLPEGTICYRLEGSSDDVIKELIKRRFKHFSEVDLDKIAEFSDGNARVAFALASTTEIAGEIARLRDRELFKRLFHQNNIENDELLHCAEVASLLYSFEGENASAESEMAILSSLAEVTLLTFSRNISILQKRGLIQTRGKWRALLPHAISNRLAEQAIDAIPKNLLISTLVDKASPRVVRSFSRRLGFLHESKKAREIAQSWLEPNGFIGDLTSINKLGRDIFKNIAPVHEEAALSALERATLNKVFISTDNHSRSDYAYVARSIAYDSCLFDRAIEVLIRFAIEEPKHYNYNSTQSIVVSLFYCHLSGTEAQSDQRAKIVGKLIFSDDMARRILGLRMLQAGLEASHFSSSYPFDFGARKRGYGWRPRTTEDVRAWYKPFIDLAITAGSIDTEHGREARVLLAESVRGILVNAGLTDEIAAAANAFVAIDNWPEGWIATQRILKYDKERVTEESLHKLLQIEKVLVPRNLKTQIATNVLARGSFAHATTVDGNNDDTTSIKNTIELATNLGKKAALDHTLLFGLLPELLKKSVNSKAWNFGLGVGQTSQDTFKIFSQAKELVATAEPGTINLMFLKGIITGWHKIKHEEVSEFLNDALHDEVWGKVFPELQLQITLDSSSYARLLQSIELGNAPVWQYLDLGTGRSTDPLTLSQISNLINTIAAKSYDGLTVALHILGMVIYCAKDKETAYRRDLAYTCILLLNDLDWSMLNTSHNDIEHDINVILEFSLANYRSKHLHIKILHKIIENNERFITISRNSFFKPFFKHYPKQILDLIFAGDEDDKSRNFHQLYYDFNNSMQENPISNITITLLIEWCEILPEKRYNIAAHICPIFEKQLPNDSERTENLAWSEMAKRVFTGARDKVQVLRIFSSRFFPMSWSGSRAAILKNRLPLLAQLKQAGEDELNIAIKLEEDSLRKQIAEMEAQEEKKERNQTGSFE